MIISSCIHIAASGILSFFNDPATTEIYTLSLHDALPIWGLFFAAVHGLLIVVASVVAEHEL